MSLAIVIGVGVLGGLGATARFIVDELVSEHVPSVFPAGTLAVNLAGAFALGVITGAAVHGDAGRLLATGLLGAFTTFSTWMLDSHRLGENAHRGALALNLALSLGGGLLLVWLGRTCGAAL